MESKAESAQANAPPHVYVAISEVTEKLSPHGIAKNRENREQKFRFRGIDDVLNALSKQLAQSKLCIIPRVIARNESQRQTRSGSTMNVVVVEVEYDLVSAVDGSIHVARTIGEAQDSADKATNKAMSASYKYMALQVFCIPTESDDNDADATHEPAVPHRIRPTTPAHNPATRSAPPAGSLLEQAKAVCQAAGLTPRGVAAFAARLTDGASEDLAEVPVEKLQKLVTLGNRGISPETVATCNGDAPTHSTPVWVSSHNPK